MSDHCDTICSKAYRSLNLIRGTIASSHAIASLVYLASKIELVVYIYCSQLWRPLLVGDIQKMERVQKRSTKYILKTTPKSITNRSRLLSLPLQSRTQAKLSLK